MITTNYFNEILLNPIYHFQLLGNLESKHKRTLVIQKFMNNLEHNSLLEELIEGGFTIREADAWKLLENFLPKPFYLFFSATYTTEIALLNEFKDLAVFVEKNPLVNFFLTNTNEDFLFSWNELDYLIAAGTAEPWLRNKAIELSKTGWKDMDGFYWDENGVKKR